MIKVLIVDDDMMVRKYIRQMIDWEQYDIEIVGEALHGQHAIEQMSALEPNVVLVDMAMPVMDGISFIKYASEKNLPVKIIVLSCRDDFEYVKEAMRLGAEDYLLKHSIVPEDIIRIIQKTMKDNIVCNSQKQVNNYMEKVTGIIVEKETCHVENKIIAKVIEYISENISRYITLEEVSEVVHLNKVYLSQLFKQQMKINFSDYVLQHKIDYAKKVLLDTQEKIYIVSEMAGFNNQYHFIRTFKKLVGVSPEAFRKKST